MTAIRVTITRFVTVVGHRIDSAGRRIVRIDTDRPDGVEALAGGTLFEVTAEQLEDVTTT